MPDANINLTNIHAFGDPNIMGTCTVAYAAVFERSGTQQKIIASKSCLAKQKLSIPRFDLVATYMAVNLTIRNVSGWNDSTVLLQWLEKK